MRSAKSILFTVVIVVAVIAQAYYLFTYYKQDKETIAANKAEIESVKMRIQQLDERLARHEESKKELEKVQAERAALEEHLPDQTQRSRFESDLVDYLLTIDLTEVHLSQSEKEAVISDIGDVNGVAYELDFVSTYDDSRALVENLKRMFQTCNISGYTFDASIQKGEGEEAKKNKFHYGDAFSSLGKTIIKFDIYYKRTDVILDEQYHSDITGDITNLPFKYVNRESITTSADTQGKEEQEESSEQPDNVQQDLSLINAKFMLSIGDAYTSGDIYKLSGPGEGENTYIGLNTLKNVEITLNVYDDHYELIMKDNEGKESSTTVDFEMSDPTLRIISTMGQLQEVMPNIHIYIHNYASDVMRVLLTGEMLDNIHIYNVNNEEIFKGQTKGNVSLT